MPITVDATYEKGVLKPLTPLPLQEQEKVRVTVVPAAEQQKERADEAADIVRRSYGIIGWTGDVETLQRVAIDPEFDPQESA